MVTWFGKKLCDKGFLINLAERTDRLYRSLDNLRETNIDGVERFEACKIHDPNYLKYGCTQSHIEIAKLQIENGWEYVLYLEDDIVKDLFYCYETDNQNINLEKISEEIIKDLNLLKPDVLWLGVRPEKDAEKITNVFLKPSSTLQSHAYIGSLKFATFLVNNLKYQDSSHYSFTYPIDFFMTQIIEKNCHRIINSIDNSSIMNNDIVIYMTTPMIFNQGESFSDLLDRDVDYKTWIKGCYNSYANPNKLNVKIFLNE